MQKAVVWKEGLFIRPQHFQQSDRYFTYELLSRTKELNVNSWGFFKLKIDTSLLDSGHLAIEKAYGIMPDGTLFDFDSKTFPLSISIAPIDAGKSIYLALPLAIANGDTVTFKANSDQLTRFTATTVESLSNSNYSEDSVTDILVASQNFKLLIDDTLGKGYIYIKIAEIGDISSSGKVSLQSYVPTYLHMNAAAELLYQIDDLKSIVAYRIEKLSEKISDANLQATELGDYLLIQVLSKFYGRLSYFLTQDHVHPGELYLELISLANELAVFMKKEKRLIDPFIYDHEKQYESYILLLKELKSMLSNVLEQSSINLPISKRKYGISVAKIDDKSLLKEGIFVLSATANLEPEKFKKILLSNFKIGNVENIRELVNYHLSGFSIKPLPAAPRQVPFRANYSYFKVDLTSQERSQLMNSSGFAFHLSGEISGFSFNLWAMRKEK